MCRTFLIVIMALSMPVIAEDEKSQAQYNIEVLDSFCVQNQDNFENIVFMAKSVGGKVLPNEMADPAMRELGSKAVYFPYEDRSYMVAFADAGGCTVVTKNIDQVNLKKLLSKIFQVKLVDKQTPLAQVNEMYEVNSKGNFKGAIISLVYAQTDTRYTDGSISFLPAALVKRALSQ